PVVKVPMLLVLSRVPTASNQLS
ncbi:MAG: hypothetical protein JWM57_2029, partial [Phycisphaerales bacterium]|nr:hypothetical protein [Phycisphaerales bacterium]